MAVIMRRTYEVRCDDDACVNATDSFLDADVAESEAIALGWFKRGRKYYCLECRPKHERKAKGGAL